MFEGTTDPFCQCVGKNGPVATATFDVDSCQCVQRCDPPCLYTDYCVLDDENDPTGPVHCECLNGVGDGVSTCRECCTTCADESLSGGAATCEVYDASSGCPGFSDAEWDVSVYEFGSHQAWVGGQVQKAVLPSNS